MKVICFGDSNTYGYDPRSFLGGRFPADERWVDILAKKTGWQMLNEGMNGREIPKHGIRVPDDAELLIVMLGTNDLLQGNRPNVISEQIKHFLKETGFKNTVLIAPPPLRLGEWVYDRSLIDASVRLSNLYRELTESLGIGFVDAGNWNVDILFDGVHFSEKGHFAFAEGLYRYFMQIDKL